MVGVGVSRVFEGVREATGCTNPAGVAAGSLLLLQATTPRTGNNPRSENQRFNFLRPFLPLCIHLTQGV